MAAEDDRKRILAESAKGLIDANPAFQSLLQAKDAENAALKAQLAGTTAGTGFSSDNLGKFLWERMGDTVQQDLAQKLRNALKSDGTTVDRALAKPYMDTLRDRLNEIGTNDAWWQSWASLTNSKPQDLHRDVSRYLQVRAFQLGQTLARK